MRIFFIVLLLFLITIPSALAIPIAEKTGLKFSFPVSMDNDYLIVEGTANFDVKSIDFHDDSRELTLKIQSSLNDNLVEMTVPKNLFASEELTFTITSMALSLTGASDSPFTTLEIIPKIIHYDDQMIFVTLEFKGIGTHHLTISESVDQMVEQIDHLDNQLVETTPESSEGGGCLIATAAYGSEMSPQVQILREVRNNTILQTQSGTTFMTGFNQFYYSFSPVIADYERENPVFKEAVKLTLIPLLTSLTILNYVDIDTEQEMIGYGIGVILLNIGMYFVAPTLFVMSVKKLLPLKKC